MNKLLNVVQSGDTIVTTEVSRITRSTKQLCDIIEICKDKKLKLIIKDSITIDCTSGTLDPMTKAFLQISGVFAELERNIISERVKSGMRNAKAKGVVCGRGKTNIKDIEIYSEQMQNFNNDLELLQNKVNTWQKEGKEVIFYLSNNNEINKIKQIIPNVKIIKQKLNHGFIISIKSSVLTCVSLMCSCRNLFHKK